MVLYKRWEVPSDYVGAPYVTCIEWFNLKAKAF
ncbi:hypothetical protein QOZ95_003343 [Paenibacillus brasilensis]|uniref:Uncharacterized protein n=1 Tax=Paenibacillus brasilensis TaxID=128574 RepID=A0ABU0L0G9_9BACL|nr:hypothetical protein [Paenibacillus brasilensis]